MKMSLDTNEKVLAKLEELIELIKEEDKKIKTFLNEYFLHEEVTLREYCKELLGSFKNHIEDEIMYLED
jgi:hypothetical protein